MKRLVELGKFTTGKPFTANLDLVLSSNLLVQANSGGGKSWLLRRMIEQTFGRVPQIIIDPEGEFSTLRGKFDIILVGKEGDTPADVRSASMLAHRLLELGVSAVIDLFEMSPTARPLWVATFIQALVDAPKRLWRELLVYVDEAHMLAPEPGHGAVDSEAHRRCRGALIEMASRGRKRGYGLVAATQRLGKLSKDFAAELKNVLIGQTFIDIDRERALGSLGIAKADKGEFFHTVKNLPPGHFYAMGRALVLEPTPVQIGEVQTEHPQAGRRQSAPPPPTDKIRHLLPQLADLPKEAEQKIATEKELRARIAELERVVAAKPAATPGQPEKIEVPVVPPEWLDAVKRVLANLAHSKDEMQSVLAREMGDATALIGEMVHLAARYKPTGSHSTQAPRQMQVRTPVPTSRPLRPAIASKDGEVPTGGLRRMLIALAQRPKGLTNAQIGVRAGLSSKSGTFATYMGRARTQGWIADNGTTRTITDAGLDALGSFDPLPEGSELAAYWIAELGGGASRMLQALVEAYPQSLTNAEIGDCAGISSASGTFATYMGKLRSLELVTGRGQVQASAELFG